MRVAVAELESVSPYGPSRYYQTPKLDKEIPKDYEARTWRDRCHVNEQGHIVIPPLMFKNCLDNAARYLSHKIPGKRNATYTKHFEAGVMVLDPLVLPLKKEDVQGEWLFVPSDGKPGGGSRVEKCFPVIPSWKGKVTYHVLDDTLTPDVFEEHLREAGNFIGIGRFRPQKRGYYGRFKCLKVSWS